MEISNVPDPLQDRLGHEATVGLIELLTNAQEEGTTEMIERVNDRFERRLAEEIAKFRIEMAQAFAALRQEMTEGFASIRQEIAETRVELLKWAFVFWAGQLVAVAGFLAVLLRFVRP